MSHKLFLTVAIALFIFLQHAHTAYAAPPTSWSTNGNGGIDDTKDFLGTKGPKDLVIKTSNSERMRITGDGDVGIGTANPLFGKLHVETDIGQGIFVQSTDTTPGFGAGINSVGVNFGVVGNSTSLDGVGVRGFSTQGAGVEAVSSCCDLFRGLDQQNDILFRVKQEGSINIASKVPNGNLIMGQQIGPNFIANVFSVDTNGNVGAGGTVNASVDVSAIRDVHAFRYVQLGKHAGVPPALDCNEISHEGRMSFDPGADILYICSGNSGWVQSLFRSVP
jgi:hypothetical protein